MTGQERPSGWSKSCGGPALQCRDDHRYRPTASRRQRFHIGSNYWRFSWRTPRSTRTGVTVGDGAGSTIGFRGADIRWKGVSCSTTRSPVSSGLVVLHAGPPRPRSVPLISGVLTVRFPWSASSEVSATDRMPRRRQLSQRPGTRPRAAYQYSTRTLPGPTMTKRASSGVALDQEVNASKCLDSIRPQVPERRQQHDLCDVRHGPAWGTTTGTR